MWPLFHKPDLQPYEDGESEQLLCHGWGNRMKRLMRLEQGARYVYVSTLFVLLQIAPALGEPLYLTQLRQVEIRRQGIDELVDKLKDYKPVEIKAPLKLIPFHHRESGAEPPARDFCVSCHGLLPHRKSERIRSYLNMHVSTHACTSCHYRPQGIQLRYGRVQLQPGEKNGKSDTHRLITPFRDGEAEIIVKGNPDIDGLLSIWKEADLGKRVELHQKIHGPLLEEPVACGKCHAKQSSMLDYTELGYDAEESKSLKHNPIARLLGDEAYKEKRIKLTDLLQ
jgi:hypothetical protein